MNQAWDWTSMLRWQSLILTLLCAVASGQEIASRSDRDAVRRGTNPVWVAPDSESIAYSPKQLSRSDVSDRHDSIRRERASRAFWDSWGNGTQGGWLSDLFSGIFAIWRVLLIVALIFLLSLGAYLFVRSTRRSQGGIRKRSMVGQDNVEEQKAKILDLPFDLEQPEIGLKALAERYRHQGDYSKAMVFLFSYALVELDRFHCIRLARGKTNGIYLRELRQQPMLQPFLREIILLFESAYFGRHEISQAEFEEVWSKLSPFETMLGSIEKGKSLGANAKAMPAWTGAGG
jgi:hypothetical protein